MSSPRRLPAAFLTLALGLGPSPVLGSGLRQEALRPMVDRSGLEEALSGLEEPKGTETKLQELEWTVLHSSEVPGLDAETASDISQEAQRREKVVKAVLTRLKGLDETVDPLTSLIVSIGLPPYALKLKEEGLPKDQNLVNVAHLNSEPVPGVFKGARFHSGSLRDLLNKESILGGPPQVALLYNPVETMASFSERDYLARHFLTVVWALVTPGGWLVLVESHAPEPKSPEQGLDSFYDQFVQSVNHAGPSRIVVVSSTRAEAGVPDQKARDLALQGSVVLAFQKPLHPPAMPGPKENPGEDSENLDASIETLKVLVQKGYYTKAEAFASKLLDQEQLSADQSLHVMLLYAEACVEVGDVARGLDIVDDILRLTEALGEHKIYASAMILRARAFTIQAAQLLRDVKRHRDNGRVQHANRMKAEAAEKFALVRESVRKARTRDNSSFETNLAAVAILANLPNFQNKGAQSDRETVDSGTNVLTSFLTKMMENDPKKAALIEAKINYYKFLALRKAAKAAHFSSEAHKKRGDLAESEALAAKVPVYEAFSKEAWDNAYEAIKKAKQISPESFDVYELGVLLLVEKDMHAEATKWAHDFVLTVDTAAYPISVRRRLAAFFHALGKPNLALREIEASLEENEKRDNKMLALKWHIEERLHPLEQPLESGGSSAESGLEERVGGVLATLAKAAPEQTGRVLVIEESLIKRRGGLEELVKRLPSALAKQVIVFDPGSQSVADLALKLMARPGIEQVGYAGLEENGSRLAGILPVSMVVTPLGSTPTLAALLGAVVPRSVVDQVDAAGLEEDLARLVAA